MTMENYVILWILFCVIISFADSGSSADILFKEGMNATRKLRHKDSFRKRSVNQDFVL